MKYTLLIFFGLLIGFQSTGQTDFQQKALEIEQFILSKAQEERDILKDKIADINDRYDDGYLRQNEADDMKKEAADQAARNIENLISDAEGDLTDIIRARIEEALGTDQDLVSRSNSNHENDDNNWDDDDDDDNDKHRNYHRDFKIDFHKSDHWSESRHTTQFVLAFGFNNLIEAGDLNTYGDSQINIGSSRYLEWGFTGKTRMIEDNNLLHFKYGFSFLYSKLSPIDNQYFVRDGNKTFLNTHPESLEKSRLRNVYLVAPVHLEFDFTPRRVSSDGSNYGYRTHRRLRVGLGGYAGIKLKTKQKLEYTVDGEEVEQKIRDSYNVNPFVYGLSGYVGYKSTSFFAKYDMSSLFRNNDLDQNNVTLGVRFDWN